MMASQSGPFGSRTFTTIPYAPEPKYPSHLFRVLLLRRLRLPLPLTERHCRCRRVLDPLGDHRAACPRSGALRSRGCPLERAAAKICREAGARVTTNTLLTDLNLPSVDRVDNRRIEVIANGLPLFQGAQLAVDTTLVSPLSTTSQPRRRDGAYAGAALRDARRAKERVYPELTRGGRCRLVVLGLEIGGRFSAETATFLRLLAKTRAQGVLQQLRASAVAAYIARWSALLSAAASRTFAASLLFEDSANHSNIDTSLPELSNLLPQCPEPPAHSRLPSHWPPPCGTLDFGLRTSGDQYKNCQSSHPT